MKKRIFIAIPFTDEFTKIYKVAIESAFLEMGLEPYRVDELKGNGEIVHEIEEGIANSDLVFADLTQKNPNVCYEVGFAKALRKNVIPAVQSENFVPFDFANRRYIKYDNTTEGLIIFKDHLKSWVREILGNPHKYFQHPKVFVHGTKFDVPDRNEFWNNICLSAERRFYLLGRSNKSWINKGDDQATKLANSILKIIGNDGNVKIVSDIDPSIIQSHKNFYEFYLKPRINEKGLQAKFKKNFRYGVIDYSNYEAVISDERIVILPTMNSESFKDESLVMELEGSHLPPFKNYLADIERLFTDGQCKIIDLASNGNTKKNTQKPSKSTSGI